MRAMGRFQGIIVVIILYIQAHLIFMTQNIYECSLNIYVLAKHTIRIIVCKCLIISLIEHLVNTVCIY